jgi:hypothetical protein
MSISLSMALLQKYRNPVFIETGTYKGGGVAVALEAGFEAIHSIEVDWDRYIQSSRRFLGKKVMIHLGDTLDVLPLLLRKIRRPATIWLDGHAMSAQDSIAGRIRYPLIEELEIVLRNGVKKHTILIDDRRVFENLFGIKEEWVHQLLQRINPKYKVVYENSVHKEDIIAAAPTGG